MFREIGYCRLVSLLGLRATPPRTQARVEPRVTSVQIHGDVINVPVNVAPSNDSPIAHLEFALKHEGVNLEVLEAACHVLPGNDIQGWINETPNGRYARIVATLYEAFTGAELIVPARLTGNYVQVFSPTHYLCGPAQRFKRFRVDFNGLGDLAFCPIVRRTAELDALLSRDLFGDLERFVQSIGGADHLDRALGWAYLDETRGSFAIENESPSADKAQRFVQLLMGAHEGRALSEAYLADLQCATIANPWLQELAFRTRQNWLQRGVRLTATHVTYVPPPAELLRPLMDGLMAFANRDCVVDPRVKAFLVSFGFVFHHPFMDGNGRLSRFLVHHGLCRSGRLPHGLILPVSVAMKHHEADYLTALETVSRPIRDLWDVTVIGDDEIAADFKGRACAYRYWDGTDAVAFGLRMTEYALDVGLIAETELLRDFDEVRRRVEARYDLLSKDLYALMRMAYSQGGNLSRRRRDQYIHRVPEAALDAIEEAMREVIFDRNRGA